MTVAVRAVRSLTEGRGEIPRHRINIDPAHSASGAGIVNDNPTASVNHTMDDSSETIMLLSFRLTILYYYETRFNLKPVAANPNQDRKIVAEWLA